MGWQSNRWFGNVEQAMLLLSKHQYAKTAKHGYVRGSEPVKYVREIRDRYDAYVKLTQLATN
jgi:membrane-bound lytic murein transglycosylase F